jgi:hypothetical protein
MAKSALTPFAEKKMLSALFTPERVFGSWIFRLLKYRYPVKGFMTSQPISICLPVYFSPYFIAKYLTMGEISSRMTMINPMISPDIMMIVFLNLLVMVFILPRVIEMRFTITRGAM